MIVVVGNTMVPSGAVGGVCVCCTINVLRWLNYYSGLAACHLMPVFCSALFI